MADFSEIALGALERQFANPNPGVMGMSLITNIDQWTVSPWQVMLSVMLLKRLTTILSVK